MTLDLRKFVRATNPANTLFVDDREEDHKYYIDFSSVRGGQIISRILDNIALWSPDERTCQLFTGHIGCGKSTELLRLKEQLEQEGFHVIYFESSQDLEMGDVDVGDILLAIARRVSQSLDAIQIEKKPTKLQSILQGAEKLLNMDIEISGEFKTPVGTLAANTDGEISLDMGIANIAAKAKGSPEVRSKLRGYLEPRTNGIIEAINTELLEPGIQKLKDIGKQGLVVIVDNLDKVDSSPKAWGRPQQEYLFVDRGEQLRSIDCHVVYTIPLALRFSNDFSTLTQRFMTTPEVLPMVSVKLRDGSEHVEGMYLLRQMVLARGFPDLEPEQRLENIGDIFDSPETLDRLCRASGGHVRNLLRLLNEAIKKERGLPISRENLEAVIRAYRNERILAVDEQEWILLKKVAQQKKVAGDEGYQTLIRSMFVYEYRDEEGSWFDINPILAESDRFSD